MEDRPSLSILLEELKCLSSKWDVLATRVNLPPETVQVLKSDSGSEEDTLREVLRHWTERLKEEGGEVTWTLVLDTVRDIDMELADSLKAKFEGNEDVEMVESGGQGEAATGGQGEVATGGQDEVPSGGQGEGGEEVKSKSDDAGEERMEEGEKEEPSTAHVYSPTWSKLAKEDIVDRVKGLIYGQAIGDALGLATEFMFKKEAHAYYKNGLKSYEDIVQDFHRSRWDKGDWTDDTDQMLLIMLMLIEKGGQVNQLDFAAKVHNWMLHGFKECGDLGGMGIGMTVKRTLTHHSFLTDPLKAANEVWEQSGRYLAANGAIMRTSILGVPCFNDIPKVVANTVDIAKVTHADPRCSASCVAVTTAIALMLQGTYDISKKNQLSLLIEKATEEGIKLLEHKDQQKEMKKFMKSSLKDLHLDGHKAIGYTFKALGAGFYGLHKGTDFRKTITEVIMEGGDADSNAAVCGALLGCKLGFKALPEDLLQFKHRQWLDQKVDAFLKLTGLA